jgi:type III secretion system YscJ/HrcJ family lipoprotein
MAWIRGCYLCAILVLVIQGCRSHETIVEGLGQNEANVVLVALREENINARKEGKENRKGTSYNILVEKSQAKDALRILVHQQLPKVNRPGFREVYPPGSSQLIPTKSDEQARLIMAQEGELEALLKIIPHVIDARVAIALEQNVELGKMLAPKSAAVALTYQAKDDEDFIPISADEIARLVSAAVGSLEKSQVMVVIKSLKPLSKIDTQTAIESGTISKKLLWSLLSLLMLALLIALYAFFRAPIASFLARRPGTT